MKRFVTLALLVILAMSMQPQTPLSFETEVAVEVHFAVVDILGDQAFVPASFVLSGATEYRTYATVDRPAPALGAIVAQTDSRTSRRGYDVLLNFHPHWDHA